MNHGEDMPANGVGTEQVSEKARDIAESVGLVSMNGVVVLCKCLLEEVGPQAVEFGESFAHEAKEFGIGFLLRTALDDHRR
jgi:hypothetical protein